MLKSKIHRATVTDSDLNYVGSITLGPHMLAAADIAEYEQVHVLNVNTGDRFITYTIKGEEGDCIINGAAARLVQTGDVVLVLTYASYKDGRYPGPTVVHPDADNQPTVVRGGPYEVEITGLLSDRRRLPTPEDRDRNEMP
jgi:aspartate 1-decarboxylase